MPTFDYAGLDATARALLLKFGGPATFLRVTGAAYDPVTGVTSGGSTTSTATSAVIVGISDAYAEQLGGNIQAGDRIALSDSAYLPDVGDLLTIGSDTWSVVALLSVNPGGVPLLYKSQVRK